MGYKETFLAAKRKPVKVKLKSTGGDAYIRRLTNKEVGEIHLVARKDQNPDEKGINFQREVMKDGRTLCRACAGERYWEPAGE